MSSASAIVIQSLIFCLLDLFIYIKVRRGKIITKSRWAFGTLALVCSVLEFLTALTFADGFFSVPVFYVLNNLITPVLFILITLSAYLWFTYLRFTIPDWNQGKKGFIFLGLAPMVIIIISSLSSYWTHWVYYIDEMGVYHRGSLSFLQVACPALYIYYAIGITMREFRKGNMSLAVKTVRNLLLLTLPAILGVVLQVSFNLDGGYSQMGISLGMIILYLNLYLGEVGEAERLQNLAEVNQKLETAYEEKQEQLDQIMSQYEVVRALGSTYFSVHEINLVNGTFKELEAVRDIHEMVNGAGVAQMGFARFIKQNVAPKFKEAMAEFVDLETLPEKLKDRNGTFLDYVSLARGGWCRASWFVLSRDDMGDVKRALFTVADVNQELSAEKEYQGIIRSLAGFFNSVYQIDMASFSFTEISSLSTRVHEVVGATGDARAQFDAMFKYLCHPNSAESMREFCNLETLNERMREKDWISQQFESYANEWTEGIFVVAERDDRRNIQRVIWCTRNINETKQKELEYKKKLSSIIEGQNHTLNILSTLAQAYVAVYYIDIKTEFFREISTSSVREVSAHVGGSGNAREKFVEMSRYLVARDMSEKVLEFTELTTLAERLRDRETLQFDFLGAHIGWCVGEFIAVNRDENGNCTHVLWAVRSIQAQKEKDELHRQELQKALSLAEAANNAKTTFLNNMSHDIRTPMNAILGFSHLMEKEKENPQVVSDYLKKMQGAGEYLLTIINNVLDMARIESGKMTLEENFVDLIAQEASFKSIFEEDVKKKNLNLNVIRRIEHPYVMADGTKTNEIAANLVSNAIKYTPEGGSISVEMWEEPCEKPGYGTYVICVSDTGIGMSEEFKEHIFESFTRERNTTESKIAGTGLGMSIVKKLVDLLGGTITVESELGKGSKFTVTLEHRIVENPEKYLENQNVEQADASKLKGRRILLTEDNDLNAEIAKTLLERLDLVVERAVDGVDCLDKLRNSSDGYYDMILMDIQMPNMNGYDATRGIREFSDPQKANIPIVAMTANAFEEDRKSAMEAGMNGHLAKPIDVTELVKVLTKIIG